MVKRIAHFEPIASQVLSEKRMKLLKQWLSICELLLVPIWGKGAGPQHWTLLIIEKTSISYCDSLSPFHKCCFANANKLLSALGLPSVEGINNGAFQSSDDCGWFVCH